jgi:hypothetical protein
MSDYFTLWLRQINFVLDVRQKNFLYNKIINIIKLL